MACASPTASLVVPLLLGSQFVFASEAARGVGMADGAATWAAAANSVRSPPEGADVASFIFVGTEVSRPSSAAEVPAVGATHSAMPVVEAGPELLEGEQGSWEADFASGLSESKRVVETEEWSVGTWGADTDGAGAVPARMLQAEAMLQVSEIAPVEHRKEKTAERALRIYYHAKWLAERNYASTAARRYREAARLARQCRRSVLASHALARLGYFLMHWQRSSEAAEVLEESMKLNSKSNPLAPYLHGVLERKAAAADETRLRRAEEYILTAGEQPSEELEVERYRLIGEISYWRQAEGSPRQCLASSDTAHVLICFFGHAAVFIRKLLFM